VQDARRDEPPGPGFEAVGLCEIEHAVVAAIPVFEAGADLRPARAGLEAEERVRKLLPSHCAAGEIIPLGLALAPHQRPCGKLWCR